MLRPWMGEIYDSAYVPDPRARAGRLVSHSNPAAETADLTGIAPALVITPEFDRLHAEGQRYAQRLQKAGALVECRDVPQVNASWSSRGRRHPPPDPFLLLGAAAATSSEPWIGREAPFPAGSGRP